MGSICQGESGPPLPVEDVPGHQGVAAASRSSPTITIIAARGLRDADWFPGSGMSDCYCAVKVKGKDKELYRTQVKHDTLKPVWNEETVLEGYTEGDSLEFTVWDKDTGKADDVLGTAVLESGDFKDSGFNGELKLSKAGGADLRLKLKLAGQAEYPPGPKAEVLVEVKRDREKQIPWGLDLDYQGTDSIMVIKIKAGPVEDYNQAADEAMKLKPGDFIISVNDATGSGQELVGKMRDLSEMALRVRRPMEMPIFIDKKEASKSLGVEFEKQGGNTLIIKTINAGPLQQWNSLSSGHRKVVCGDRICAVGGFRGKAVDLDKKLERATSSQVTITRPADPEWS